MSSQDDKDKLKQLLQAVLTDGGLVAPVVAPAVAPAPPKFEDHHVPWWIKIFGSAIVVIIASVLIGIVQNLYSNVHDLGIKVNERCITKEEYNTTKTSQWNLIRECQDKTGKLVAVEERLKLSEERLKKVEIDNANLRESVTRMEEQLKAQKGNKGME
jgi:hypothetical protein